MTKLSMQNLPRKGVSFYHCKLCGHWVPWKDKHLKKIHGIKK